MNENFTNENQFAELSWSMSRGGNERKLDIDDPTPLEGGKDRPDGNPGNTQENSVEPDLEPKKKKTDGLVVVMAVVRIEEEVHDAVVESKWGFIHYNPNGDKTSSLDMTDVHT